MSLPAFASSNDYTALFGDVDVTLAQAALDRASTIIRSRIGSAMVDEDNNLDFSTAKPWAADTFAGICVQVAHRVLDNPGGVSAETIGAYSFQQANASADAYLTAQEKAELAAALGRSTYGVWTLPTTRSDDDASDFINAVGSDEPMPFSYAPLEQ